MKGEGRRIKGEGRRMKGKVKFFKSSIVDRQFPDSALRTPHSGLPYSEAQPSVLLTTDY
jgi:hypothetical protein